MKILRKTLSILFILSLFICLVACGVGDDVCKNHKDTNKDGICEECGKAVETPQTESVDLIKEDGSLNFAFVLGPNTTSDVRFRLPRTQCLVSPAPGP